MTGRVVVTQWSLLSSIVSFLASFIACLLIATVSVGDAGVLSVEHRLGPFDRLSDAFQHVKLRGGNTRFGNGYYSHFLLCGRVHVLRMAATMLQYLTVHTRAGLDIP